MGGKTRTSCVYAAALKGVGQAATESDDTDESSPVTTKSRLSLEPVLEGDAHRSHANCPNNHMMKADQPKFWRRWHRDCNLCGSNIPSQKACMSCRICSYFDCNVCWERRRTHVQETPARANTSLVSSPLTCYSGHLLERLVGQVVHGDRSFSSCGKESLGSTVPFYLSCRPCRYELCPSCSRQIERTVDAPTRCRTFKGDRASRRKK